jgi:hypothetical protein
VYGSPLSTATSIRQLTRALASTASCKALLSVLSYSSHFAQCTSMFANSIPCFIGLHILRWMEAPLQTSKVCCRSFKSVFAHALKGVFAYAFKGVFMLSKVCSPMLSKVCSCFQRCVHAFKGVVASKVCSPMLALSASASY